MRNNTYIGEEREVEKEEERRQARVKRVKTSWSK